MGQSYNSFAWLAGVAQDEFAVQRLVSEHRLVSMAVAFKPECLLGWQQLRFFQAWCSH